MSQHKAVAFPAQGKPAEVVDRTTPSPKDGEVLVKVHAVATNPVDYYIRDTGYFASSWPMFVGEDIAGEVVEVGAGVTNVKKGDRVLAAPTWLLAQSADSAGYQEHVVLTSLAVTKIPDSLSYADAAVIPLSASTSASGLFTKDHLALDYPSLDPKPNGKKLLIWGAGTSVAGSAIQLAVAAGYEVITTASEKNLEYAKKLGASKAFDYRSPSVVGDITAELQEGFVGAYDAAATEDSQLAVATIVAQLGGGRVASVLPVKEDVIPASVTAKQVMAIDCFGKSQEVGEAVFQKFLPAALASGQFLPMPKAQVVGQGVEAINDALDKHKAGVSATKLVVTL